MRKAGSEHPTEEQKAYLRRMAKSRGYVLRLDRKTKELVFTAVLTALGAGKEHIKAHIEVTKREGATKEEVLELLEMLITPCGAPKFKLGYEEWAESFPVRRMELD